MTTHARTIMTRKKRPADQTGLGRPRLRKRAAANSRKYSTAIRLPQRATESASQWACEHLSRKRIPHLYPTKRMKNFQL